MRYIEKQVILQTLDHLWRDHLVTLDHLRQVIGWRGMAQRDPLNEYKSEAFELFRTLITQWHEGVIAQMMRIEVRFQAPPEQAPSMQFQHLDPLTGVNEAELGAISEPINAAFSPATSAYEEPADVVGRRAIPTIPRPGAGSAATSPAPAARARSSSTATACWSKRRGESAAMRLRRGAQLRPLADLRRGGFAPAAFAAGQAIGLLGGSFNPPHAGHLLASHLALTRRGLDRVWWLATPGNPLKSRRRPRRAARPRSRRRSALVSRSPHRRDRLRERDRLAATPPTRCAI